MSAAAYRDPIEVARHAEAHDPHLVHVLADVARRLLTKRPALDLCRNVLAVLVIEEFGTSFYDARPTIAELVEQHCADQDATARASLVDALVAAWEGRER